MQLKIVGILNLTSDSFSGDGVWTIDDDYTEHALKRIGQLFRDGADMIDIGAESTRPNATRLTDTEEWERLQPVLQAIFARYQDSTDRISIDTYHPDTVQRATAMGDFIINDVTGLADPAMRQAVADSGLRVIISHLPRIVHGDIQAAHALGDRLYSSVEQVRDELYERVSQLEALGIDLGKIILDPGIGFGKTMELNRELLTFAREVPDFPVMIGYSKKRFLGDDRMQPAPNLAAFDTVRRSGAAYVRVHDVAAHAVRCEKK